MYYKVNVFNTECNQWLDYTVTENENRLNGYVLPAGYKVFTKDEDSFYAPVKARTEFVIRKGKVKSSVYKRHGQFIYPDRYDYAFTERTTKTTVTDKDVYYNERKNRFVTNSRISTNVKTEYNLPRLIIF